MTTTILVTPAMVDAAVAAYSKASTTCQLAQRPEMEAALVAGLELAPVLEVNDELDELAAIDALVAPSATVPVRERVRALADAVLEQRAELDNLRGRMLALVVGDGLRAELADAPAARVADVVLGDLASFRAEIEQRRQIFAAREAELEGELAASNAFLGECWTYLKSAYPSESFIDAVKRTVRQRDELGASVAGWRGELEAAGRRLTDADAKLERIVGAAVKLRAMLDDNTDAAPLLDAIIDAIPAVVP